MFAGFDFDFDFDSDDFQILYPCLIFHSALMNIFLTYDMKGKEEQEEGDYTRRYQQSLRR